jgi:hypothetical protein
MSDQNDELPYPIDAISLLKTDPRKVKNLFARYTYCLPLERFRSYAVISRASDEHPGVARPWPGGEKRRDRRVSHHEACEAIRALLLLCAAIRVSLLAVWCLRGATPRGSAMDARRDTPAGV